MSPSHSVLAPALLLASVLMFFIALSMGPVAIDFSVLFSGTNDELSLAHRLILKEIRVPRALLVYLVGAVLGLTGAAMQGLLRNPLAEPGLLGVSSAAALGAVIVLYYGFTSIGWWVLPVAGVCGALLSVAALLALSGQQFNQLSLILSGVAINVIATSAIAVALNFAPNPYAMSEIVYWLMGSFLNKTFSELWFALPMVILGCGILLSRAQFLNALSLGESTAMSLGFNLARERVIVLTALSLAVGAAVAVCGAIGFVGLVIPHLVRQWGTRSPGLLMLLSALAGGLFLQCADIFVQWITPYAEMKIGVVTALIGGPFFLGMVYQLRSKAL